MTTAAPRGFKMLPGAMAYDVATTAAYAGHVQVCVAYDAADYDGYEPHLFRLEGETWTRVTTSIRSSTVCGSAETLGTFATFAGDPSPPVIVPYLDGPLRQNRRYFGGETWVTRESPVSSIDPAVTRAVMGEGARRLSADPGAAGWPAALGSRGW